MTKEEVERGTTIYRPVIEAAAGALIADASGYDFGFVGVPPDHEPPGSLGQVEGVVYRFEDVVAGWEHQLVILRVGLGKKLVADIIRGRDPAEAETGDASYLEFLLSSKASRKPRTCKLIDAPPYTTVRDNPRAAEYIACDTCRWVLELLKQPWAVPVIWTLCCRVEELRSVPRWTLDLMRRSPDTPPRDFLDLDWRQKGLREAIERRLVEIKNG